MSGCPKAETASAREKRVQNMDTIARTRWREHHWGRKDPWPRGLRGIRQKSEIAAVPVQLSVITGLKEADEKSRLDANRETADPRGSQRGTASRPKSGLKGAADPRLELSDNQDRRV